jgi:4-aminobutyrate aminotransferase/(S)-3-amino-2-methylpropionate transaminase
MLLSAGTFGNILRTLMPLTIELEILEDGLTVFEEALKVSVV